MLIPAGESKQKRPQVRRVPPPAREERREEEGVSRARTAGDRFVLIYSIIFYLFHMRIPFMGCMIIGI